MTHRNIKQFLIAKRHTLKEIYVIHTKLMENLQDKLDQTIISLLGRNERQKCIFCHHHQCNRKTQIDFIFVRLFVFQDLVDDNHGDDDSLNLILLCH